MQISHNKVKPMKISTKSRYGLRALTDLALHYMGKPILIKDIAKREDLSESYLENIFTKLRKVGILLSCKGRGGGFYLAKDPKDIKVLEIIQALEGKNSFSDCIDFPFYCKRSQACLSRDVWVMLNRRLKDTLSSITLYDLINKNVIDSNKNTL